MVAETQAYAMAYSSHRPLTIPTSANDATLAPGWEVCSRLSTTLAAFPFKIARESEVLGGRQLCQLTASIDPALSCPNSTSR